MTTHRAASSSSTEQQLQPIHLHRGTEALEELLLFPLHTRGNESLTHKCACHWPERTILWLSPASGWLLQTLISSSIRKVNLLFEGICTSSSQAGSGAGFPTGLGFMVDGDTVGRACLCPPTFISWSLLQKEEFLKNWPVRARCGKMPKYFHNLLPGMSSG